MTHLQICSDAAQSAPDCQGKRSLLVEMFKQKFRKSRKHILSRIEAADVEDEETEENLKIYKPFNKTRKKEIRFREDLSSPKGKFVLLK